MTMTTNEAMKIKIKAIKKADRLDLAGMAASLLQVADMKVKENTLAKGSLAIPGSGYVMLCTKWSTDVYDIKIGHADNTTELVLLFKKYLDGEDYEVFRDGPWVEDLGTMYQDRWSNQQHSKEVLEIVRNFSPLE